MEKTHIASDVKTIKSLRAASNLALEAHDLLGFISHFDQDYSITYGSGEKSHCLSDEINSLEAHFKAYPDMVYVRTPDVIYVHCEGSLALEHGRWKGGPDPQTKISGRYSAGWRRTEAGWKIHSELYVTLSE